MPTRDANTFARKALPDLPGKMNIDQFGAMVCGMMDYYDGLGTDIASQNTGRAILTAIHKMNQMHSIAEYVQVAEADWLRNWLPDCLVWLADNQPNTIAPMTAITREQRKLLTPLVLLNPLAISMAELAERIGVPKHKLYNLRTQHTSAVETVDGEDGSDRTKRSGRGVAPSVDVTNGLEYYRQTECHDNGRHVSPLYVFHARAWGMRQYAAELVRAGYSHCPLIENLSVDWLLHENTVIDGMRPYMMARDAAAPKRHKSTRFMTLPTYHWDEHAQQWVMHLTGMMTHDDFNGVNPYFERDKVTSWGMFNKILDDCMKSMRASIYNLPATMPMALTQRQRNMNGLHPHTPPPQQLPTIPLLSADAEIDIEGQAALLPE
jgi:hypothetical protein